MKIAIAVFTHDDKLICKQDISELSSTYASMMQSYPNEISEYIKQDFLKFLDTGDFRRLIERVP